MKPKIAGIIIILILFTCLFFLNNKDVRVRVQDHFELHKISAEGIELQSVIHLYNPNLLSSTIKTIHENFYINGVLMGIIDNELNQGIPARKETEFPVSIRFYKDKLKKALQTDSLPATSVKVEVNGEIDFQNLANSGKIRVHTSATAQIN